MARTLIVGPLDGTTATGFTNMETINSGDIGVDAGTFYGPSTRGPNANPASARWTGAGTFTDDQYFKVTVSSLANFGSGYLMGGVLRGSGSASTATYIGVAAHNDNSSGAAHTVTIYKYTNGVFASIYESTVTLTNGDTLEAEATGASPSITVTVYKNGAALGGSWTQTGITGPDTGTPGLVGSGGTAAGMRGDSVELGNVGSAAPSLSSPTATATGPTQATIGLTTDTAPGTTTISYQILPAADSAPSAATIDGTPDGTITTGSIGALTKAITGLTTNTAVKAHFAQGASSNVVSTASFTPNTLAIAGTALSAQTGTAGAAFTWTGSTPERLITTTGNGTPGTKWTATAGVGASGVTVNASSGILVAATLGTAGSYTITLQRTDASTVPSAQTVTKSVGLTISSGGGGTGTLTLTSFKQWTGTAHTSITVPFVKVCLISTGAVELELEDQAVNSSGNMVITNAAITSGEDYMVFGFNADGSSSFKKKVTAT